MCLLWFDLIGLDSATSDEVVGYVRELCNQDRTIILSIHQPSPTTFKLFDLLLLLSEGRVFYFGPACNAVSFFTESPFKFVMPEVIRVFFILIFYYNSCDFLCFYYRK